MLGLRCIRVQADGRAIYCRHGERAAIEHARHAGYLSRSPSASFTCCGHLALRGCNCWAKTERTRSRLLALLAELQSATAQHQEGRALRTRQAVDNAGRCPPLQRVFLTKQLEICFDTDSVVGNQVAVSERVDEPTDVRAVQCLVISLRNSVAAAPDGFISLGGAKRISQASGPDRSPRPANPRPTQVVLSMTRCASR